jgi:hypothetical protein
MLAQSGWFNPSTQTQVHPARLTSLVKTDPAPDNNAAIKTTGNLNFFRRSPLLFRRQYICFLKYRTKQHKGHFPGQDTHLIIGHTTIIALEGLVVFVQTSRLVLFEFFTQFLRADGRFFQPLSSSESPRDR